MRAILLVLTIGLAGLLSAGAAHAEEHAPRSGPVIVIGIDGLRYDSIDRHPAPTLQGLAARGVRAAGLIPVFPSVTFPNFYSLATGLHPDRSGVLGNSTYDRALQTTFTMRTASDPRWFQGEPIWASAERQGVRAATLFWVGSEAATAAGQPSYWHVYDGAKPHAERIAETLAWLDLPAADRPGLIMLYFSALDSASHRHGVGSPEERAALADIDATIADLIAGLAARGLLEHTDLVVIGDHGMEDISQERVVHLDDYLPEALLTLPGGLAPGRGSATSVGWFAAPEEAEAIFQALALAHPKMQVWRRAQIPERFRFEHPDRTPDVLALAEPGWLLSRRDAPLSPTYRATHGWDPAARTMHAGFIAAGPSFQEGRRTEAFPGVDVYGLIARLLGISPAPNDGAPDRLAPMLR